MPLSLRTKMAVLEDLISDTITAQIDAIKRGDRATDNKLCKEVTTLLEVKMRVMEGES